MKHRYDMSTTASRSTTSFCCWYGSSLLSGLLLSSYRGCDTLKKRTKKPLIKHPPPTRELPEKVSPHKRTRHFLCQCWTPSPDEKTKNYFVLTYHYRGRCLVFAQVWFYMHESLSSKIFTRSSRKFLLSYQTFLSRMFTRPEKSFQRKSRENFIKLHIDVITKKMKTSFS